MKIIRLLLSLIVFGALIYLGNTDGVLNPRLPAIGEFIDPFGGFWQQAEAIPIKDLVEIDAVLEGVEGEVSVDERGVPHIFAPTLEDAFALQGYWHAKDRLWQMDIATRATGGRLAEILGERLLERDRIQVRKGMREAAARTLVAWSANEEEYKLVQAYTKGVNAYIETLAPKDYPVEFKFLGYAPEPWTNMKSALFFKSMAETLCFRSYDIAESNTLDLLGDSLFQHIFPERNPLQSPIIPKGTPWKKAANTPSDTMSKGLSMHFPYTPLAQSPEGVGSNNWAVSGAKTQTGAPILSNDPHLRLTLPAIWYEIQIQTPEINAYGVSLPGNPGVIIGFNENIAWGETNVGQDVVDWYKMQWADESKTAYMVDGQQRKPEWKIDTIWVKGQQEPVIERTPWTMWGPVVYTDHTDDRHDLAMRWIAHDRPQKQPFYALGTFLRLMKAKNYTDYRAALAGYDSPAQNFVFAAQDGDIAITVNGKFPIKDDQQGRFVQQGNTSRSAWKGFIPREEVPAIKNPARGFVASANQHSTDDTYPYYYNGGFDDYRGRYINRRLANMENITVDSLMALQYDAYSIKAEEAVPVFLEALANIRLADPAQTIVRDLQNWDFVYRAEAKAPIFFEEWFENAYQLCFDEVFQNQDRTIHKPEYWRFIDLITNSPEDNIFDQLATPAKETSAQIIQLAFTQALDSLGHQYASADFNWNTKRNTVIPHMGNIPGFDSGLIHSDGFRLSPNALSSGFGPSWRMIVSMTDPVEAWGVFPGGASGNPGSPLYTDGVDEWAAGKYFKLHFMTNSKDDRFPIREHWVFK